MNTAETDALDPSRRMQIHVAQRPERQDTGAGSTHKWIRNPSLEKLIEDIPREAGSGGHVDVVLTTGSLREEHRLENGRSASIGRSRGNAIRLPENLEEISGEHSRLTWENGWLVLEDRSTNGTYLDGVRVQRAIVRPGTDHQVSLAGGVAVLRVEIQPQPRPGTAGSRRSEQQRKGSPISIAIDEIMKAENLTRLDEVIVGMKTWSATDRTAVAEIVRARRAKLDTNNSSTARASLLLCCFLWGAGFRTLYLSTRVGAPSPKARGISSLDELRAVLTNPRERRTTLVFLDELLRTRFLECWLRFAIVRPDLSEAAEMIRQDGRDSKAERWSRIAGMA